MATQHKKKQESLTATLIIKTIAMIVVLMAATFLFMRWITPTTNDATAFLLGFGVFCFATVGVALLVRWVARLWQRAQKKNETP